MWRSTHIAPGKDNLFFSVTELSNEFEDIVDSKIINNWTNGYIATNKTTVDISSPVSTTTMVHIILPCSPGDTFTLTGASSGAGRLWAFLDSSNTVISVADSGASGNLLLLQAPVNSVRLVVNVLTNQEYKIYSGVTVKNLVATASIKTLLNFYSYSTYENGNIVCDLLRTLYFYEGKTIVNANYKSSNVLNFTTKLTDLASSNISEIIAIRDYITGRLLNDLYCTYGSNIQSANICFGYTKNGTPDRSYKATDVVDGKLVFDESTYFITILHFTTVDLSIKAIITKNKTDYYVGPNMEYTTIHECLNFLKGNKAEKRIHIYGGEYDIIEERGGQAYLDNIAQLTGNDPWRNACDIIPPNTHVIGHGKVVIKMEVPNSIAEETANLISPINIEGSCTIENLTINCSGGRYCIHAEGSKLEEFNNAVWRIINCRINKTNNLNITPNTIGVGINDGNILELKDCIITNDGNAGLMIHDNQVVQGSYYKSPTVLVSNCAFDVTAYPIVLSSTHSRTQNQAYIEVSVINCFCNNKFMRKIGTGNDDVFKVTYINTKHRTQNGGVLNIIPDTEYIDS